jgi:N-acetylmuramoyl-L-alanine amidase
MINMAKIKLAIDAGHGSNTTGKRTPPFTKDIDINKDGKTDIKKGSPYKEHYANVGIARLLYQKLTSSGFTVIKTGWNDDDASNDPDTPLSTRQQTIKKAGCDYSISIHFNAYGDGSKFNSVNGVEVYIHSENSADSKKLAEYVVKELAKGTTQKNRGVRSARLAMCNCNTMKTKASILCEIAFMTNKREAQELMANSTFWEECANEIATAVIKYCNYINPEEPETPDIIYVYHTVVAGNTLSELAEKNGTSIKRLVALNKIKNPDRLTIGQKILVQKYIKYIVQKGDTLSKISKSFLGDADRYDEIIKLNNLKSNVINISQSLKIPID